MTQAFLQEIKAKIQDYKGCEQYNFIAGKHLTLAIKTVQDAWLQLLVDGVSFVAFKAPPSPLMVSTPLLTIAHRQSLFSSNMQAFQAFSRFLGQSKFQINEEVKEEAETQQQPNIKVIEYNGDKKLLSKVLREIKSSVVAALIMQNDSIFQQAKNRGQQFKVSQRNLRKFDLIQEEELTKIVQYALYSLYSEPDWHVASAKNIAVAHAAETYISVKISVPSGRIIDLTAFKQKGISQGFFETVSKKASNEHERTSVFVSIFQLTMFMIMTLLFLGGKVFCSEAQTKARQADSLMNQMCEYQNNVILLIALGFIGLSLSKMCKAFMERKARKMKQS